MKQLIGVLTIVIATTAGGCKTTAPAHAPSPLPSASITGAYAGLDPQGPTPVITMVHEEHKFVVVDFSSQAMPPIGSRLSVYRNNKRVGEVQITEPVRARFATADILSGELLVGDKVY